MFPESLNEAMVLWTWKGRDATVFDRYRSLKESCSQTESQVGSEHIVQNIKERRASVVAVDLIQFDAAGQYERQCDYSGQSRMFLPAGKGEAEGQK